MVKEKTTCDCNIIHQEVVLDAQKNMPSINEFQKIANFFKVFGDETRTKIIWSLLKHEMCVCDLSVLLNMTKSAVSHQLAFLKSYNLVNYRREGKVVYYSLADDHVSLIFNSGREHINEK